MRKLLLILPVALVALATAVAVRAAAAPPRSSDPEVARQVSRTFTLRWPRHVAEQEAYVEPIDIPTGQVEKVSVAVAGRRQVGEEPRDYVVAWDDEVGAPAWLELDRTTGRAWLRGWKE